MGVIESQKWGLLHAHLLYTLEQPYHPDSPDKIDRIVLAFLPDPDKVTENFLFFFNRNKF